MRLLLLLTCFALVSATAPVLADAEQDCFQGKMPELRIRGCSEIIQRNPNDATAYHNRAVAFGLAGDLDSAIADYTKAIEIAPNNASAYENRGRAYAGKGDYTKALADTTKASELMAKAAAQPTGALPETSKKPKVKTTARVPPKTKAKSQANDKVGKEPPSTGWWSWLWGNDAGQPSGKNVKP